MSFGKVDGEIKQMPITIYIKTLKRERRSAFEFKFSFPLHLDIRLADLIQVFIASASFIFNFGVIIFNYTTFR